jgi:hypothetical protein
MSPDAIAPLMSESYKALAVVSSVLCLVVVVTTLFCRKLAAKRALEALACSKNLEALLAQPGQVSWLLIDRTGPTSYALTATLRDKSYAMVANSPPQILEALGLLEIAGVPTAEAYASLQKATGLKRPAVVQAGAPDAR